LKRTSARCTGLRLALFGYTQAVQKLAELLKNANDPQALINAAVDMPYRTEDDIRALFARLQLPLSRLFVFGTCSVAQIGK
jgi:hypothetical protein